MDFDGLREITLQQLEALVHLVAERGFVRAARKMRLTQPSLTKHIQNLEKTIGEKMVIRGHAGISLTPAGRCLYEYAQKIAGHREELKEKMAMIADGERGLIQIIASTIPATYILPRLLSHFHEKYPEIQIIVKSANSEAAMEMILNQEAEIGFTGQKPAHRMIHGEALWHDRLILAVPGAWPKRTFSMPEFMALPFVMREQGSGTRQAFEGFIAEKGGDITRLNRIAELGSSEAVKEAILAGMGASLISIFAVQRALAQGGIAEAVVEDWRIERHFFLIYRKQYQLPRQHQLFLDFLLSAAPKNDVHCSGAV